MKHLTEYSDPARIRALVAEIARISKRPARIMEVCGGQTHAILRHALDTLLPAHIQLLHGPGCPVCVTPSSFLDHAIAIARRPDTIVCTFGDLLRVPSDAYDHIARALDSHRNKLADAITRGDGFVGAETSQWRPAVFEGTKPVEPYLGNPDYNFDYDLADQAIR